MKNYFKEINATSLLKNPTDEATNKAVLKDLSTFVAPLLGVEADYPKRVLDYILTGEDAQILQALQSRPDEKAGILLDFPASLYYHCSNDYYTSHEEDKLATQGLNARYRLYQRMFTVLHNSQIIRYSKFLCAVTKLKNYRILSPVSPDWFTYLVADGLYTTLYSVSKRNHDKYLAGWKHSHLIELLELEAVAKPYEVLISLMFQRDSDYCYDCDSLNFIYQLPDTCELLTNNKEILTALIPKLSADGQMQFINELPKFQKAFINQCPKLLVMLTASPHKIVREIAIATISLFDNADVQPHFTELLLNGNAKQRREIADMLARGGEENRSILEQALTNEKQKSVVQAIQSAISRLDSLQQAEEVDFDTANFEPIVSQKIPNSFVKVLQENYEELLEKYRECAEIELKANKDGSYEYKWDQKKYKEFKKVDCEKRGQIFINALNGEGELDILRDEKFNKICNYKNSLQTLPEFGLHHCVHISTDGKEIWWSRFEYFVDKELLLSLELRQLAQVMVDCRIKNPNRIIGEEYLLPEHSYHHHLPLYINSPEKIVPFFMENIDFISEALGLLPNKNEKEWRHFHADRALDILMKFPQVPKNFIPKILELALSDNKRLRHNAQEILSHLPNIHQRAIEALSNGKQDIRVTALKWLARINIQENQIENKKEKKIENKKDENRDEIAKALYALLKKEKKEIVIASILTTLESLGEDISKYLSPTALLKDAEKGLKGKLIKSFEWFEPDGFASLPAVTWQDGKTVNPKIIQWWVVFAEKFKDPTPNGLLHRYMGLLDDKSQHTLSRFILQSFIDEDTRGPTLAKATSYAQKTAPEEFEWCERRYKNSPDRYPEYANITFEQVYEKLKNKHLGIYLGSAIKSKGMLALAYRADGTNVVSLIQDYMKRNYYRTHQITAILTAFSMSDDPLVIQLLLGVSRRYRTASIQELAKNLVGQIAKRNQWTADELADRTIPSAGLGDDGVMAIDYGSRTLTAYVNNKDKFILNNEDGKVIKSLPAPRQSDGDDEKSQIKEAKSLFSNSKKELKQVLEQQTARLYESMCSERLWTTNDWQEYLFAHPIMKRLITRLVWLEVDKEGNILHSFRPSDDGSLLGYDDEAIILANNSNNNGNDSLVKLAHGTLMSTEDCERWQEHLTDYEVKPLFGGDGKMSNSKGIIGTQTQFDNACPEFKKEACSLENFHGYVTDAYTLRGVLTKMGYQRARIEDGGSFSEYYKNYDSLGVSAVIGFSGNNVPEENVSVVVYELYFEKMRDSSYYSWRSNFVALDKVNPILLAETFAEYKKLADATAGFDAEWEKKTRW